MDNPYDVTDSERLERDWQAEQRAEARFLRETYTYWQTDNPRTFTDFHGLSAAKQLNLFEEAE